VNEPVTVPDLAAVPIAALSVVVALYSAAPLVIAESVIVAVIGWSAAGTAPAGSFQETSNEVT
jgi:hypothetical protein